MRRLTTTVTLVAALLSSACSSDAKKRQYLENGNRFVAEKKYVEAILEYRNALQVDDKFAEARVKLAETLAASGNTEGAYREYQRAADLLPDDSSVQVRAGTLLFMAGQFEDVRTRMSAVLKKNPKNLEAQILYANALVGLNDLEGGVQQIEEAIQLDPAKATTYTNLALLKLAQGQREDAERAFRKAVDVDPKSLKARLALAYFLLSVGDVPGGEKTLTEALTLAPTDPLANRTLAALYMSTGRERLAEAPLKLVVEATNTARSKFALADYYARTRQTALAKAVLEPMARGRQTEPDARVRLARLDYESGDHASGKKKLDALIARYPNHAPSQLLKARWLLADGRPAQALERVTAAVNVAPQDSAVLYFRGTLQALLGQTGEAVKSFNDVLSLNPRAGAAQTQLAQINLRVGQAETAVGLAQEAVANSPGVPEPHLVLVRALIAQRDLPRAERELATLERAFPGAAGVTTARGTLELLKGNRAAARAAFQKAFDASPSSISALSGVTLVDVQEKRVAEARSRVEKRLAAEPKRSDVLVLAAKVAIAGGDFQAAEKWLREVLTLVPAQPEPYVILGDLYRQQGRLDAARGEFDEMVQRNGADLGARTMAAVLQHAQGRQDDAKRRYTELLAKDPRAVVAANNLAWIYADERQNLDLALELAERATEQLPEYAEAWDTLGWVYQRKQLPLLAIAPFEKAVQKDPENAIFRFHLGLALAAAGDRDRGRESFQAALKLQPDYAEARREIQALDQ